mmetsp:Transcript_49478/g.115724  ORF Transcript_49478/g.115724 Transcript_49478/m.115724 type:complete len:407 (-) Transcript_49478:26-1246(-)
MVQWPLRKLCCCCRRCCRGGESEPFHSPENSTSGSFASACEDLEESIWPIVRETLVAELHKASTQALQCAADFARGLRSGHQPALDGPLTSWRNNSSPGLAECYVRTMRGGSRQETSVAIAVETVHQAPHFPLVESGDEPGSIRGALIQLLEFDSWPRWMMYSEQATVIKQWGPGQQIVHLSFKLPLGVRLEAIVFVALIDRLDKEGFLEVVVCSPASALHQVVLQEYSDSLHGRPGPGSNGFLGVHTGGKRSRLGVLAEVDFAAVRIYPHADGNGVRHRLEFSLAGEEKLPLDRVVDLIWRSLSRNLVSILGKHVNQDRGSIFSPAKMAFYQRLADRIDGMVASSTSADLTTLASRGDAAEAAEEVATGLADCKTAPHDSEVKMTESDSPPLGEAPVMPRNVQMQ